MIMNRFPSISSDDQPQSQELFPEDFHLSGSTQNTLLHPKGLSTSTSFGQLHFPNAHQSSTFNQNNSHQNAAHQNQIIAHNSTQSPLHSNIGSYAPRMINQNQGTEIDSPVITDANLYIKNIDYDISDEDLYSVFSKIGEITSHHIVRDAMKRSRGFGFM
jgi:RNA recognition motif-containing protein